MSDDVFTESSPAGLFTVGPDSRLRAVNATFERITGVAREAAMGRTLRSLLTHASQIIYALKVETALLAHGRADEILLELAAPSGPLAVLLTLTDVQPDELRYGVLFPAPERRAYELELIAARRTADQAREARDLLLREVYHRVKNNLQTVDSLLLLQRRRLSDPEAMAVLETMRARIFALGLVHHQLMGSSDLQTFDVAAFLKELAQHLQASGGREVGVEVVARPLRVGLDFAIPLGLIVTELVTNALKHGFPEGRGLIKVTFEPGETGEATLRVTDNGVGFAEMAPGEASLGLSIVRGLVGQLGGRIADARSQAAAYEIHLPLPGKP